MPRHEIQMMADSSFAVGGGTKLFRFLMRRPLGALVLIFLALCAVFWGRWGHLLIDCGVEAYIPWMMMQGKILYRDFFILVQPLAYQLNWILFEIFGPRLSVLYFAGIFNGALFLVLYYRIVEQLLPPVLTAALTFAVILLSLLSHTMFSFIFPYCYGMPYASTAFLASLYCLLMFLDAPERKRFLRGAFFFFGVSLCCKHEYALFGLVLAGVVASHTRTTGGTLVLLCQCSLWALTAPVLVAAQLIHHGLRLGDVLNYAERFGAFVQSDLLRRFYANIGVVSIDGLLATLSWSARAIPALCATTLVAIILNGELRRGVRARGRHVLLFSLLILAPLTYPWEAATWLGMAACVCFIAGLFIRSENSQKYIVLGAGFLLGSAKTITDVKIYLYGSYSFPYLIAVTAFAVDRLVKRRIPAGAASGAAYGIAALPIISISALLFVKHTVADGTLREVPFYQLASSETAQGNTFRSTGVLDVIYWYRGEGLPVAVLSQKIRELADSETSLLVLPEGTLINFINQLPGFAGVHNLSPIFFASLDEQSLLNQLTTDPPHLILLLNRDRREYFDYRFFGENYGQRIMDFVESRYCRVPSRGVILSPQHKRFALYSISTSDCEVRQ